MKRSFAWVLSAAFVAFLFCPVDSMAWVVDQKADYPVKEVHDQLASLYSEYRDLAQEMDTMLNRDNVTPARYAEWQKSWTRRMMYAEARLHGFYGYFMPINQHPWTREAAVFTDLQGVREWLWTVEQDKESLVSGSPNFDIDKGKIYPRNIEMYRGFLLKAGSILTGGPFSGNFFKDTQATILANYCVYPEVHQDGSTHMTKLIKPSFQKMGLQNGLAMEHKNSSKSGVSAH